MTFEVPLQSLGLDPALSRNLLAFVDLFERWNDKINLSAARTRSEIIEHVVDSLHVIPHLDGRLRILDVGSGGGFPVAIAAICLPTKELTALEPIHKKHSFLKTAARELGLANLNPLAERIEDHQRHDYDAAMSRATFDLKEWLVMGLGLVKPGGVVLGFEATLRDDLPTNIERRPYALGHKTRSIIVARG